MKIAALGLLFFSITLSLFLWWAVGKSLPKHSNLPVSHYPEFAIASEKGEIKIATYNIAYGQGIKLGHTDWRDKAYTEKKLEELSRVVQDLDADVLFLQEVDLDSNRSHFINEAEVLVRAGKFPYSACAIVWDETYVPFPFWPPEFHLGQVVTANCILSKYPMKNHERIIFDKPKSNPFWYNWGYLDRGAQKIEIQVGSITLTAVNLHLEAFEEEAREKQARIVGNWVKDIKKSLVVGGDFNAVPSNASKKNGFVDETNISYDDDHTIDYLMESIPNLAEAISPSLCDTSEHLCFTFPANDATRRLDYLFATNGVKFIDGRVVAEAGGASDHLPVLSTVTLKHVF